MIYITLTLILLATFFIPVISAHYPIILKTKWRNLCHDYLKRPVTAFNITLNLNFLPPTQLIVFGFSLSVLAKFGFGIQALAILILIFGLILLTLIDLHEMLLPDEITLTLLWIGLTCNIIQLFTSLDSAVIGAIFGYTFPGLIAQLFKILKKKDGMGNGDFKMLAMIGAWLGYSKILSVLVIATLLALATYIIFFYRKNINSFALPFGPFLAFSTWIILMFDTTNIWRLNYA